MDQQTQVREPFIFSGNGSEYFRIWIVNLCLSVLTLGIYSAWAKVRRLQYFYRHTTVAGASLDYHGDPVAILKGRIIAVVLFGAYGIAGKISPMVALAVFAFIMVVMPWLVVRSLRFRLHNTSYRGLRFAFHGKTGDGYVNFLLLPLASYLTAGLIWPLAHQQITRFTRNHSTYGNTPFEFHAKPGAFYKPYLAIYAVMIGAFIAGIVMAIAIPSLPKQDYAKLGMAIIGILVMIYLASLLFVVPFLSARLQNIIWNHTTLGPHAFSSDVRARGLFGIMASNLLLIILTLGLYKPFADIRLARYRIDHITLLPGSDFDEFVAIQEAEVKATGEEVAEIFDMDIAF